MGETKFYTCPKCCNTYHLNFGFGMMWHSYTKEMFYPRNLAKDKYAFNIYDKLLPRIKKEVYQFIETASSDIVIDDVSYQLYKCDKCGKYETKIHFCIYDFATKQIYTPQYNCTCKGKYIKSEIPEIFTCHKCGTNMIEDEDINILWD